MGITTITSNLDDIAIGNNFYNKVNLGASQGALKAGRVLALGTATAGQYITANTAANTNNQHLAVCVLADDVGDSAQVQSVRVITAGLVRDSELSFAANQNADSRQGTNPSIRESLQSNGITVLAGGTPTYE